MAFKYRPRDKEVQQQIASRLMGLDEALIEQRGRDGHYGKVRREGRAVWYSVKGLECAGRRSISQEQIEAAKADRPLPRVSNYFNSVDRKRPHMSIDEIGAATVRED